jgi:hypothetical protein
MSTTSEIQQSSPIPGISWDEFREMADSVMVAIPHRKGTSVCGEMISFSRDCGALGIRALPLSDPFMGFVDITRGKIVKDFLRFCNDNPEVRFLMMIDADEKVSWQGVMRLVANDLPIVSGVVCSFSDSRGIFACFMAEDETGVPRFPSIRDTKTLPGRGVKEIVSAGTGMMCIRRDVLETIVDAGENPFQIPPDIHEESNREGKLIQGEDMAFCNRARRFGFPTCVDFSVHAGHWRQLLVAWTDALIDDELDAKDWKPSKFDYRGVK